MIDWGKEKSVIVVEAYAEEMQMLLLYFCTMLITFSEANAINLERNYGSVSARVSNREMRRGSQFSKFPRNLI